MEFTEFETKPLNINYEQMYKFTVFLCQQVILKIKKNLGSLYFILLLMNELNVVEI